MNSTTTGKFLAIIGAVMQVGPFVGLIGTVMGMRKAFDSLGASGVGDPAQLSNAIGGVLIATAIGTIIGLIGAVLIFVSLLRFRYRAEWLFWFLVICGSICLLVPPIGTGVGIAFVIYALMNRAQFFVGSAPSGPPNIPL